MNIADRALDFVAAGQIVGLGSGRAATAFLHALARAVRDGLRIRALATSEAVAAEAHRLGVPLTTLAEIDEIDVAVDGADEVDPDLNVIKGNGGALVRERIIESASRRLIILVGTEKLVSALGARGRLPIEIVPFSLPLCVRRLARLGLAATPRMAGSEIFVTDNGNYQLDCAVGPIADPRRFDRDIRAIPGVIDTGLFLGMADTVLIQDGDAVVVRERRRAIVEPPINHIEQADR
jgi:ribose 5-phosphate isomerase A